MPNRRRTGKAGTRARDVDRTAVREALDSAFSDGQLSQTEHRSRVDAARSARTLDDLDRLVRDLQVPPALSDTVASPSPPARSTRWIVAVAAAVVLMCGFVVVTSNQDRTGPAGVSAGTALMSAEGLGRMLDDIARNLDNSQVDQLTIYPDYATFSRPVPGAPGSEQSYTYEDGQLEDNGRSPGRTQGLPVDLAELRPNVPRVIGLFYGADRTLRVDDPTQIYMDAKRGDDGPVVSIHLKNETTGAQGFLTVGFDGEVRSVYRADQ